MQKTLLAATLVASLNTNAVLGPIPIYLNTEYRTQSPVIGSIASTIKLDRQQIAAIGVNTFTELLGTIPSVGFVYPQGNVPAVFLRGTNSEHTLFIVDGVKIHNISSTNGAVGDVLEAIPLDQIERIEIVKGPYSSLYGSGAIGGVIQIFTKNDNNSASIIVGSNNSKRVSFSSNNKSDKGFINFNLSKYQTDGISALTNNSEKDAIDNQSIGFKIGYSINNNTDFAVGFLNSTSITKYDSCFTPIFTTSNNCFFDKNLSNINLAINHQFNDFIHSKLSFAEINQDREDFTDGNLGRNSNYQTKDLTLLNQIKLKNAALNIGLSKIDDKNIASNQELSSKDIFTQWQKNIANFDVNAGVRFIHHSDFDNETVYNISVARNIDDIKLTGSYGTAFNAPTIFQLNGGIGNQNLMPETSKNIELGIEKHYYWGLSGVKFYKNRVESLIDYNYAGTPNNFTDDNYFNTENILNIKGVELSISANIKNYDINFSHNFVDSKLSQLNTQHIRRPRNTTNLTISKTYNKFNSRLQIIKKSSSLDDTTFDGAGDTALDGYTLTNLSTGYNYNNKTKISLSINNALDKDYTVVNNFNQLGRSVNLGLNYNF